MTKIQLYKAGGAVAVIFLGWYFGRKRPAPAPTGDVELGIPTVTGSGSEQLGGQGYYSPRPAELAPTSGALAEDPEMARLIEESNRAIAEAGGPPE